MLPTRRRSCVPPELVTANDAARQAAAGAARGTREGDASGELRLLGRRRLEQRFDLCQRTLPDAGAHAPAFEVVEGNVDAAPQARLAGLIGRVVVSCPFQADFRRRSLLEEQVAGVE